MFLILLMFANIQWQDLLQLVVNQVSMLFNSVSIFYLMLFQML